MLNDPVIALLSWSSSSLHCLWLLAPDFEERLLHLSKQEAEAKENREEGQQQQDQLVTTHVPMEETPDGVGLIPYTTSRNFFIVTQSEEQ